MADTSHGDAHVSCVAFAPDGGWWLAWADGSVQWEGLPTSLHDKLLTWKSDKKFQHNWVPEFVSISPSGGWFVRWDDGSWEFDGVPDDCAEKVNWLQEKNHAVGRVHLG